MSCIVEREREKLQYYIAFILHRRSRLLTATEYYAQRALEFQREIARFP